jgi:superfamily II DNA or RNA helicase
MEILIEENTSQVITGRKDAAMNFLLTETIIKRLCGETSYKKGEAYYQAKKVTIKNSIANSPTIEASISGDSIFHVSIPNVKKGYNYATCTCPTLASINTYCQHIAAVLHCIRDTQSSDGFSKEKREIDYIPETSARDSQLTNEMLSLFGNKTVKPSWSQRHFETRDILHMEFTFSPCTLDNGKYLFGIQAKVGLTHLYNVHNLRDFLDTIERRESYEISPHFTYYPEIHSFEKETNALIRQLINIHRNEKLYLNTVTMYSPHNGVRDNRMILIPPSFWEGFFPLLSDSPLVKLDHDGSTFNGIRLSNEPIPLRFEFEEANGTGYKLVVKGLNQITILESYGYVLSEGKMIKLPDDDCMRLVELKQMLDESGIHQFAIPSEQMEHFVETVIPGLMKLGQVKIAQTVSERLVKNPLKAKLFLDRVKNRLLAGLEFHYGNIVVNPLEENGLEFGSGPVLMREGEKERNIIQMMEESSFSQTEGGYYMHNEEAEYNFLYHVVPKLKTLVEVYATTAVKLRIHKGYVGPMIRVNVDERTDWLSFRFDIKDIPESEIRNLIASLEVKRKYYRMPNGSLLSLETKEFQKLKQFINGMVISEEDLNSQEIRLPLINGMQLINSLQEGEIIEKGESFRKLMGNLLYPDKLEFTIPGSLNPILRDYQKDGYRWLKMLAKYKFGGILADDMGLGKTVQSIAFIVSELSDIREKKLPVLIVSPSSLVYNWMNELEKFAPEIRARIVDGNKLERNSLLKRISDVDVVITSYPLLRRDSNLYVEQSFHTMILDEAQSFKNYATQTAKAVKRIQADYRFALTGTPIENSLEEIWSIFNVVFPDLLPKRKDFNELTREKVAKRVRPFLLRRLKADVLKELPEKIESIQSSELNLEQKKLYAAYLAKLKHETLKHLNKGDYKKNQIKILAGLTRLRQLCCHPALFVEGYQGSSAKFEQLMDIVKECQTSGKRILIFSQFTKMLEMIGRALSTQGVSYFYLDGKTPSSERVALCNRFNEGEQNVFLISLKAGGTGLNLTGADTVVLYDLWWNPAVEQQAADRAHRMGQKKVVQVIRLIASGTIEDKMNELQEKKRDLIGEVINSGQENLSTITEQDIREILRIN